jgi:hypothetical protein
MYNANNKGGFIMAKPKYGYGWAIKWALAAVILAAGILSKIYEEDIVYAATGLAVVIFSVFRVYPLMKTLKTEVLRTINLIEIIFEFIIGAVMVYVAFSGKSDEALWTALYGYMLTFFLLARGVIYFVSLYYFNEKSEAAKFWTHMFFIAIGPVVLTLTLQDNDTIISTLGWILLVVAIGGGIYLGFDGYGGYRKYREYSKSINQPKEKEKDKPKDKNIEKELPKPIEDEAEQPETYIS